jgi:hypothetical protein
MEKGKSRDRHPRTSSAGVEKHLKDEATKDRGDVEDVGVGKTEEQIVKPAGSTEPGRKDSQFFPDEAAKLGPEGFSEKGASASGGSAKVGSKGGPLKELDDLETEGSEGLAEEPAEEGGKLNEKRAERPQRQRGGLGEGNRAEPA